MGPDLPPPPGLDEKFDVVPQFTEHFNNMSYWTRTLILNQPDPKVQGHEHYAKIDPRNFVSVNKFSENKTRNFKMLRYEKQSNL